MQEIVMHSSDAALQKKQTARAIISLCPLTFIRKVTACVSTYLNYSSKLSRLYYYSQTNVLILYEFCFILNACNHTKEAVGVKHRRAQLLGLLFLQSQDIFVL